MMTATYVYSAERDAFFPVVMRDVYESVGTWPADGVEVDDNCFKLFTDTPPDGKIRGTTGNGQPAWVDIPPPTKEQLIASAESEKQTKLAHANALTADWRTELALGVISDEDKSRLILWMQYIRNVKAVDTSTAATTTINWPQTPEK